MLVFHEEPQCSQCLAALWEVRAQTKSSSNSSLQTLKEEGRLLMAALQSCCWLSNLSALSAAGRREAHFLRWDEGEDDADYIDNDDDWVVTASLLPSSPFSSRYVTVDSCGQLISFFPSCQCCGLLFKGSWMGVGGCTARFYPSMQLRGSQCIQVGSRPTMHSCPALRTELHLSQLKRTAWGSLIDRC